MSQCPPMTVRSTCQLAAASWGRESKWNLLYAPIHGTMKSETFKSRLRTNSVRYCPAWSTVVTLEKSRSKRNSKLSLPDIGSFFRNTEFPKSTLDHDIVSTA